MANLSLEDFAPFFEEDRIEIRSSGALPSGITAAMLSGPYESILRNPLIAGAFHRTGAVEVWGRGTNRVIEECTRWGVEPPSFDVVTGSLWVTFPAVIGPGARGTEQVTAQVTEQVTEQVTAQVVAMLRAAEDGPVAREALQEAAGIGHREHFRKAYLEVALNAGWLERTVPEKPRSSKQRYRMTEAGRRILAGQR